VGALTNHRLDTKLPLEITLNISIAEGPQNH